MKKETLQEQANKLGITKQAVWLKTEKGRAYSRNYKKTDVYKAVQKRHRQTDRYKATLKAYRQTEKYKISNKKASAKYYQKQKNLICDNTDCLIINKKIKKVKMKQEFGGGIFNWCKDCRERDNEMIKY